MMNGGFTTESQRWDKRLLQRNWNDTAKSWRSRKKNNSLRISSPMASKASIRRRRNWYVKLVGLFPKPFRERFGEGMEQTFTDLCRERVEAEKGLFSFALWAF